MNNALHGKDFELTKSMAKYTPRATRSIFELVALDYPKGDFRIPLQGLGVIWTNEKSFQL